MQTIGVLGGFGPQATTQFEERVHEEARRILPPRFNQGFPPMVTLYLRHPPIVLVDGAPPPGPLQVDPRVLEAARRLGEWSDFLVVVANTPHLFLDQIRAAAGRDVLSMVDLVVEDLARRGIAGAALGDRAGTGPVGLLGLGVPQAYVDRFAAEGIDWIGASEGTRAELDDAILRTIELSTEDRHREVARRVIGELRGRGASTIVLGCTEIPLLLGNAALDPDLIDPGRLLARAAVHRAVG